MKKMFFIALSLIIATGLFAQKGAVEKFFNKYKDNENFTSVYISKSMFNMIIKNKGEKDTSDDILKALNGLDILTTDTHSKSFFDEAKKILYDNGYEELLRVKDKGTNVLFLVKDSDGTIAKELVFLILDDKQTVMMSFTGDIPLDKISELGNTVNIEGKEYFDDIKKNNTK